MTFCLCIHLNGLILVMDFENCTNLSLTVRRSGGVSLLKRKCIVSLQSRINANQNYFLVGVVSLYACFIALRLGLILDFGFMAVVL